MELWIRSQDRKNLIKCEQIKVESNPYTDAGIIFINNLFFGTYFDKRRALEVLDEINNMLKNKYIVQANCPIGKEELKLQHDKLINDYSGEFIMQPPEYKIEQVNNCIYYEMPKE